MARTKKAKKQLPVGAPLLLTHGRLLTITNGIIEDGDLLLRDGKIAAIGSPLEVPDDARVIDLQGATVTPGLIDCHTHISNFSEPRMPSKTAYDGNEMSDPVTPYVKARDALNPFDPAIRKVRNAGFTTVCTLPGSANIIGGTTVVYKLRGTTAEEMIIPGKEQMKFALGENPKNVYTDRHLIKTRMGNGGVLRRALYEAKVYAEKKADAERKDDFFEKDFAKEALLPVIEGKMRCRIHSHRADDIVTAITVAEEYHLDFSIEHCTEGYKIKDYLAEHLPFAVVGPMLMEPYKQEIWGLRLENAGELVKAGVTVCLTADTSSHTCYLPQQAGTLTAYGLDPQYALRALTLNPATLLGVADRMGSLEVGKDADVAVFTGDPLANMTRCSMCIIDGKIYFEKPQDSYLKLDYEPERQDLPQCWG